MEQTKNEAGLEGGGNVGSAESGNQAICTSVNVSPSQGGQWNNVNGPVHPPPLVSSVYATAGTTPGNQIFMGHNSIPGTLNRERERDRIQPGIPGLLPSPAVHPVMNSGQQRHGEWDCPECNGHNYATQLACFKCGKKKPVQATSKRPGDWYCSVCSAHNYASRDLCFKCNGKKIVGTESVSYGGNRRPGD